jgi:hypothetical protein
LDPARPGGRLQRQDPPDQDGRGVLVKLPEIDSFDDREIKPHNIGLHIGRRPLLAFGNSDGDLAMLRYTASGPGPRLALLIHHDDAEREFAYDREFRLSPLAEALDGAGEYGITVVSMKRDWNTVFDEPIRSAARREPRMKHWLIVATENAGHRHHRYDGVRDRGDRHGRSVLRRPARDAGFAVRP